MKKHLYFLAALLLSACQVAEENIDNAPICHEGIVFTAGFEEPDTKVFVDEELHTRWNTGDEISIFTSTANQEFTFDGVTGDREGNFNPANPGQFHSGSPIPTIYAVYPYSKGTSVSQNGTITLTLPEIQHYAENTYGPGANTMVAVTPNSYSNILCFKNLCGFIVLKLYGDAAVKTITLTGNNGEKISGPATVSPVYGQAPTVTMSPSAGTSITLDCGDGVELGRTPEEATAFWFVVPPVTFSKGFTIRVEDETGAWLMERSTSTPRIVTRKVRNTLTPLEIVFDILMEGNIPFADANFKAYCVQNFDKNSDGEISFSEAVDITEIILGTDDVSSINEIKFFKNLRILECTGKTGSTDKDANGNVNYYYGSGKLTQLDLSHNKMLQELRCGRNRIRSLDFSHNPELTVVNCRENPIKELDFRHNPVFQRLQCYRNRLASLDFTFNPRMTYLHCEDNLLTTLNISNNLDIYHLNCSNNQLSALDVSNNPALLELYCNNNQLTSLDVNCNTALQSLNCSYNLFTSLHVSKNPSLSTLKCYSTELTTLWLRVNQSISVMQLHPQTNVMLEDDVIIEDDGFRNYCIQEFDSNGDGVISSHEIAAVRSVNVNQQSIASLDGIQYFGALEELNCSYNQLSSLDVSLNTKLTGLYCNKNQLSSLDVSLNTKLTTLDCYNNQLSSLDVSQNRNLITLYCYNNQLSSLDVSLNTDLTELYCSNNQLSSLDVSQNTKLTWLYCSNNQLSSLDVSQNTKLTWLYCSNNQLPSLDVSQNTKLTTLYCNNNQLSSLDVSHTKLTTLDCSDNPNLSVIFLRLGQIIPSFNYDTDRATIVYNNPIQVQFEDANFKAYCVQNFDTDGDGEISNYEAENVSSINVATNEISSLGGIEEFKNLTTLVCRTTNNYYGNLTSLDVSQNTKLIRLDCSNNQLSSLDVSQNTKLTTLYCNKNQLSSLDVSQNTKLTTLYCNNNQLSSLDVSQNTELTTLYCYNNPNLSVIFLEAGQSILQFFYDSDKATVVYKNTVQFTDTVFKAFCVQEFDKDGDGEVSYTEAKAVTKIEVATNGISSLGGIEEFKNLTTLVCKTANNYYGNLTSLDVSQNTKLTRLNCYANRISSLDLSHNTELTSLDCSYNQLSSLDLRHNTKLDSLDCSYNQLVSLDVSHNPAMNTLRCSKNKLESLSLSNEALLSLFCRSNKLTVLDVSLCPSLEQLDCCDNYIQSLDLSKNTHLIDLLCYNNELSLLDVSHCLDLEGLRCQDNHLTTLDVRHNEKTTAIVCFGNQMTDLYLGSSPYLYYLNCSQNAIKSLDVSHFPALRTFNCSTNRLTTLDVSNNPVLDNLSCEENPDLTEIWLKYGQTIRLFSYDTGIATVKYKD